jgi:hypothetical protein
LQELYLLLSFSQTKHFANLTSDFAPCPMAFCNAASQKGTKLKCWWGIIGWHVVVALMNNAFCFVRVRWYKSFVLAGFKDLHCIRVWIPTYPIQVNAS